MMFLADIVAETPVVTGWYFLLDKVVTAVIVIVPAIALWLKAKAAESEARAAKVQSELNTDKANTAAKAALIANEHAVEAVKASKVLVEKIEENTSYTKKNAQQAETLSKTINGRMDELIEAARKEGFAAGFAKAKEGT